VITDATPANPNGSCEKVVRTAPKAADPSARSEDQSQTQTKSEDTSHVS